VLVVDDDPVSLLVSQHILRTGNYDVVTAVDAEAAMAILRADAHGITAIVSDYHMPGASGLDLLEILTADGEIEHQPPFVLLTGVGEADELNDKRAELVSGYLTKPVQSNELLAIVAELEKQNATDRAQRVNCDTTTL